VSPFSNAGTVATDTWTACGDVPTLNPPIDPQGFTDGAGTFGMTVTATEFDGAVVEFWQAVEDSPGAGTFGSFALVAVKTSELAGPTTYQSVAPNDGLTYQIKALHARTGWTDSAYTAVVTVDPWGDPVTPPPNNALSQSTDTFPLYLGGIGGSIELVGLLNGRLAVKYSVDDWATDAFLDSDGDDEGPYAPLEEATTVEGPWATMDAAARANIRFRLVAVEEDGTETIIGLPTRSAKNCAGYKYVRLVVEVDPAGTVTTDPVIWNAFLEFAAVAQQVAEPPEDPEDPPAEGTPPNDYPVSRALRWWAICDQDATFSSDGTGLKICDALGDLSGNNHDLASAVSGSAVKKLTDADGAAIPQINGRDPLSFKDAYLEWATDLFDAMTEGELFLVVKGNAGDPATNDRNHSWTFGTHTGPGNQPRWALSTGGGADTGEIREDFGSTVIHATGDVTGALDDWRIYNVRAKDGHFSIYLDGVEEYSTGTNTVAFSATPKLGSRSENSHFHFAEGAIHETLLTTAERALVLAKLQERWAL
jgi:hypothetical protein